ncbi:phage minor tail protein L [Oligella urethralis]|uniref:Phage minor tail protein L n=2 Tax=Oligella urethralis TaxID=90245 RepID=A0A2X1UUD5_9BURK|nr:phage minor tail protein L [Oligella urethralis]
MTINSQAQLLEPGAEIELYELDATSIGGEILRFHGYLSTKSIWWQGKEYRAWPIQADGFGLSGEGQQPTPTISFANLDQSLSPLLAFLDDLVGAKVTRYKTLGKFLDAKNFPNGNPHADPTEQFRPEIYYVYQKKGEDHQAIELSLRTALDLDGVFLPQRQVTSNLCSWVMIGGYRGPYCGYTGSVFTNERGERISDPNKDTCDGKLSTCRLKHGLKANLPYGGFPAASLVRT